MNVYEKLLDVADGMGLSVEEYPFREHDGLIIDNMIGIRKTIPTYAQKADVLCEEICHAKYTVGNILDQSEVENCKQEETARRKAYEYRIGLSRIADALRSGCQNYYEMAEYLGVHEQFLVDALHYYNERYGQVAKCDDCKIQLEPTLTILKLGDEQ